MFKNYGNTCFLNCILYTFYYSSALSSLLDLKQKQLEKDKKEKSFITILQSTIQDEKALPDLIKYLSVSFPQYSYGQQFDASELLLYILDHLKSDWYSVKLETEKICIYCQTMERNILITNCTLLYDSGNNFSDALMNLNREVLDQHCNQCHNTTRQLNNIKITPPLLWCLQFPSNQKSQNVLLPTEFEYISDSIRYRYCLVSVVVHIKMKKDSGHYITFIHCDKRVYKAKVKKTKSFDSLRTSSSTESIRESLTNVDISCTFSNKAKFLKCDDEEVTVLNGTEMYKNLALPNHHLYLVWYQLIDKKQE